MSSITDKEKIEILENDNKRLTELLAVSNSAMLESLIKRQKDIVIELEKNKKRYDLLIGEVENIKSEILDYYKHIIERGEMTDD